MILEVKTESLTLEETLAVLKKYGVQEFSLGEMKVQFPYHRHPYESDLQLSPAEAPAEQDALMEAIQKAKELATKDVTDDDILDDPYAGLDQFEKKD